MFWPGLLAPLPSEDHPVMLSLLTTLNVVVPFYSQDLTLSHFISRPCTQLDSLLSEKEKGSADLLLKRFKLLLGSGGR